MSFPQALQEYTRAKNAHNLALARVRKCDINVDYQEHRVMSHLRKMSNVYIVPLTRTNIAGHRAQLVANGVQLGPIWRNLARAEAKRAAVNIPYQFERMRYLDVVRRLQRKMGHPVNASLNAHILAERANGVTPFERAIRSFVGRAEKHIRREIRRVNNNGVTNLHARFYHPNGIVGRRAVNRARARARAHNALKG